MYANPHKCLQLPDVRMRLLDANLAQRFEEVTPCQDAHLHTAQGNVSRTRRAVTATLFCCDSRGYASIP